MPSHMDAQSSVLKHCPLLADVSEHEQVDRVVQQGLDHFGKLDLSRRRVCNRAPIFLIRSVTGLPAASWIGKNLFLREKTFAW